MALFHRKHLKSNFALAMILVGAAFALSLCLADAASAQPAGGEGHRPPPPEALQACKSLASGAACKFTSPQGSLTGSCWAPQDRPLACRPKDAPAPGRAASGARP